MCAQVNNVPAGHVVDIDNLHILGNMRVPLPLPYLQTDTRVSRSTFSNEYPFQIVRRFVAESTELESERPHRRHVRPANQRRVLTHDVVHAHTT
jgi:hypothetical protein